MVYLASTLIAFGLFFAELSFFPHFLPLLSVPFLILPFISIISLKDRSMYPIILAGIMGILTDAVAETVFPVFSTTYLVIAIISKFFLNRYESYGEFRANVINLSIGVLIIYGTELALHMGSLSGFSWILPFVLNIGMAFLALALYVLLGRRFFVWVEKKTEERFR